MDKKFTYPRLQIKKLVLVGTSKDYEVKFHSGLNIIYGDEDTGKSSILNLIDYCLGAKEVLLYPQIQLKGKYCLLEVKLNGKTYTIRRDIFNADKEIDVYTTSIKKLDEVFPTQYYPRFKTTGELEHFSNFLLNALGLPKIHLKQAPSKEDSKMVRLSFRDLFKYCYFDQDSIGSKHILNSNDHFLKVKNQEVFKYIFNILDNSISEFQATIAEKTIMQNQLVSKYKAVSAFFRDTQLESENNLKEIKETYLQQIRVIQNELSILNSTMLSDSEEHNSHREHIVTLEKSYKEAIAEIEINKILTGNNISLRKEYVQDVQKIKAALEVIDKVKEPTNHEYNCPLCSSTILVNDIKETFDENDVASLERELNKLNKRIKEVDSFIQELQENHKKYQDYLKELKVSLEIARRQLDSETSKAVSPYLTQIEVKLTEKATLEESLRSLDYLLKVRRTLNEIDEQNIILSNDIDKLRKQLNALKDRAPDPYVILETLTDLLKGFLSRVKLKELYGLGIDNKTFLPILRDKEYAKITSGGVRTLVSIGYALSLLNYSLFNLSNHPKLIMLDTVGKYLGKNKSKYKDTNVAEDSKEGITTADTTKYTEMYRYFITLNRLRRKHFQLIVVDNELPEALEAKLQQYVVKHFDEDGRNRLAKGFIDDID